MKRYELDDPLKIDDMTRTRAYGLVRAFLDTALTRARATLETPCSAEDTASLRGEIKGLRQALDAPASVVREIREATKRGTVGASE